MFMLLDRLNPLVDKGQQLPAFSRAGGFMKLPCDVCGTVKDVSELEMCIHCGHVNCEGCIPTCEHAVQNYIEALEESETL
jgi:hypothetical protein